MRNYNNMWVAQRCKENVFKKNFEWRLVMTNNKKTKKKVNQSNKKQANKDIENKKIENEDLETKNEDIKEELYIESMDIYEDDEEMSPEGMAAFEYDEPDDAIERAKVQAKKKVNENKNKFADIAE